MRSTRLGQPLLLSLHSKRQEEADTLTLMVLSPEADTMYLSSKSTTLTAARWPTRTRRKVMSVAEAMSHTAMERSLEQVTISPLLKRKCRTASLWWINVFRTSPVFTSQTLDENRTAQCLPTETTRRERGIRALGPFFVAGCGV